MQSPEPSPVRSPGSAAGIGESAPAPSEEVRKLRLVRPGAPKYELTALEREFLPPLLEIQETPPSQVQRQVLWTIVALVLALLAWSILGKVSIVATAPGKFIPDGRVKEVQPLESSIVKAIHVEEGQHVHIGDLLLELDPTLNAAQLEANADKYGFNQLEQARLNAELRHEAPQYSKTDQPASRVKLEESMRKAREQAHAAKLAAARATVEEKTAALDAAQATLKKYEETTAIAEERESSARPLVDTGAISRVDYLQLKEELAKNRNDLASQQKTVQQAQAAVKEAEQAVEQVRRDRVADIYNDLNQRVTGEPELKGDLDKARDLYALKWLRAPVSGTVQSVGVTTIGQVVTPAQSLVTIVPDGTPLIVEATISNQDIGYVRVGQSVEIKVDTFPFQKYGTLQGRLVWVSPDAEDRSAASKDADTRSGVASDPARNNEPPNPNTGYVYKVHIRAERLALPVAGEMREMRAGMTVQSDITTDHRRVIEFFLSPVIKYMDEGLKVR
jgi:hemolysin D